MAIKTVIFDLDGTLLYSLEDLKDSVNFVMKKHGFREYTIDEVREAIGNGVRLLMERILPKDIDKNLFEECLSEFKENYSKNMYNKTKPYDGVLDMLKALREEGYNIAVLSNKFDSAVKELSNKYFGELVDLAVGQKEGVKEKPSPLGIQEIAKELDTDIETCIMVGDSEVDIQTANNAGIDCISVTWGYKNIDFLYDNGATKLVYAPEDILELL
mgnify:FL=1